MDGKRDKNDNVKIINSAVLTLPITVIGRDVPTPTFSSSTIDVVAGESATTIDLTVLTHSASDLYDDEKQYTYSGGTDSDQGEPCQGEFERQADRVRRQDRFAGNNGERADFDSIFEGHGECGRHGSCDGLNRPLARINAKTVKVKAGSSEEVNLLSDAYNPFPDSALTVTGCSPMVRRS